MAGFHLTPEDSLDRANLRNPLYYALRVDLSPNLTFAELSDLHNELMMRHRLLFDFSAMKSRIQSYKGVYMGADLTDVARIPGCELLFIFRMLKAAKMERLVASKQESLDRYEQFLKNNGDSSAAQMLLHLDVESIKQTDTTTQGRA